MIFSNKIKEIKYVLERIYINKWNTIAKVSKKFSVARLLTNDNLGVVFSMSSKITKKNPERHKTFQYLL